MTMKTTLLTLAFGFTASTLQSQPAVTVPSSERPIALSVAVKRHFSELHKPADRKAAFRRIKAKAQRAGTSQIWKPLHECEEMMEGEWLPMTDYYYTYDKRGLVLTNTADDGMAKTRSTFTYNENDLVAMQIDESSFEDSPFENVYKKVSEYDAFVVNCPIRKEVYGWDAASSAWVLGAGNCYTRTVTRDAQNDVTKVEIATYYAGEYAPVQRHYLTYEAAKPHHPVAYKFDELVNDGISGVKWEESISLRNMVWDKANGQITWDWTLWLDDPDNHLKSADVYLGDIRMGTLAGEHRTDGGWSNILDLYPLSQNGDMGYKEIVVKKVTDGNGSYEVDIKVYNDLNTDGVCTDDELAEISKQVAKYDERGNELLYEEYMNDGEGGTELTLMWGLKNEFTYDSKLDVLVQTVFYEYGEAFDEMGNPTGELGYQPMMRLTADQFVDVTTTTGISAPELSVPFAAPVYYDLRGVNMGTDASKLSSGVYVVKQGAKAVKVVKK